MASWDVAEDEGEAAVARASVVCLSHWKLLGIACAHS